MKENDNQFINNCTSISATVYIHNYPQFKKSNGTSIIKNIFNKNQRRSRDVKTHKVFEQGWEVNIGPKIKQNTSIYNPT